MATTINSYSVGLSLDASSYVDGANLSRRETKMLIADINKARNPAEEFSRAQDRLTKAYQAGAINLQTYNRLLDHHKSKMKSTIPVTESKTSSLEKLSQVSNVVTASLHAVRAAIDMVGAAKSAFDEVTARIDSTTKSAQKLGLTFTEITSLNFAASEAGVSIETLERGIKEMIKRGFSTGDVRQDFLAISEEISGMATQAERMERAIEIFGKGGADMLVMLQGGRDAIEESVAFAEKWNSLTEAQVIGIEQYNDTWGRVATIIEGVTNTLVAEFAPVLTLIGESVIGTADTFGDVRGSVREIVDIAVYLAGWLKDINDIVAVQQKMWYRIVTLDFSGFMNDLNEAATFDTAEKWLQATYDKRFELEQQAAKRVRDLEEQRNAIRMEGIEDAAEAEKQKIVDYTSLYQKAISAATKKMEEEAKGLQKMLDSIAKGPASLEVGSAAAASFMANATNAALAATVEMPEATVGEEALLEEAAKQLEEMQKIAARSEAQVTALQKLVEVSENNGFRRIR